MYHIQFLSDQPNKRITPEEYQQQIDKHFIKAVLLLYMRYFMPENTAACRGVQIDLTVPENIAEERERRSPLVISIYKTDVLH